MRLVASAVTAFALLAHAVLGCCSHHAHAADSSREESAAVEHCHEHDCHESEPSDSDGPERGPCDEADCSLASGSARLTVESPFVGLATPVAELAQRPMGCAGKAVDGAAGLERPQGPAMFVLHQRLVI
jgi:hypothetical protein